MDQIEEVPAEFTQYKNEQCIQIKSREGVRSVNIILTNSVSYANLLSKLAMFKWILLFCWSHFFN